MTTSLLRTGAFSASAQQAVNYVEDSETTDDGSIPDLVRRDNNPGSDNEHDDSMPDLIHGRESSSSDSEEEDNSKFDA